jgi:hypothetical protein
MNKGRVITIFKDLNDPYIQSMIDGAKESPEERSIKFFQQWREMDYFFGNIQPTDGERKITIRKAEWI